MRPYGSTEGAEPSNKHASSIEPPTARLDLDLLTLVLGSLFISWLLRKQIHTSKSKSLSLSWFSVSPGRRKTTPTQADCSCSPLNTAVTSPPNVPISTRNCTTPLASRSTSGREGEHLKITPGPNSTSTGAIDIRIYEVYAATTPYTYWAIAMAPT